MEGVGSTSMLDGRTDGQTDGRQDFPGGSASLSLSSEPMENRVHLHTGQPEPDAHSSVRQSLALLFLQNYFVVQNNKLDG